MRRLQPKAMSEIEFYRELRERTSLSFSVFQNFCRNVIPGRPGVFIFGQKPKPEIYALWIEFVETHIFPMNMETASLIVSNFQNFEKLPPELEDFLDYHNDWISEHAKWKTDNSYSYSGHAERNFPAKLDGFIQREIWRLYVAGLEEKYGKQVAH